jgi:hypothetical protein
MNDKFVRMRKETIVMLSMLLSQYFCGGTEENFSQDNLSLGKNLNPRPPFQFLIPEGSDI